MFESVKTPGEQTATEYDLLYAIVEKSETPVSNRQLAKITGMKEAECELILHALNKRCEEIKLTYPLKTVFFGGCFAEFVQKQEQEE